MKNIKGDLLTSKEWDIAIQVCNLYHCFGGGIAKTIREKFPEVFEADLATVDGDIKKLGTFSYGPTTDSRNIYNIYSMNGLGNDGSPIGRNMNYDHFYNALYKICVDLSASRFTTLIIGCPKYIGCARAGGSWIIVEAILKDIERLFDVEFTVHEFGDEVFPQSTNPRANGNKSYEIFPR